MIKEYDLKFFDATSVDDEVLYERYVDQIGQLLIDCGIFTSVEKHKPQSTGTYADYYVSGFIDQDKVVEFGLTGAPVTSGNYKTLNSHKITGWYANGVSSGYAAITSNTYQKVGMGCRKAYCTSNGVIIQFYTYASSSAYNPSWGSIVIAKSNKAHPVIVLMPPPNYVNYERATNEQCHSANLYVLCYPDESLVATGTSRTEAYDYFKYMTTAKQSLMFPFTAYGAPNGNYSYTKYGMWIPFAPSSIRNGGFQKVLVNGKSYVIDGYFALRDD